MSLRSASRAVNLIRAGFALDNYSDLQRCEVVLLSVPDDELPKWVEELLANDRHWARIAFVTCSNRHDSSILEDLRRNGAHTGSLSEMEGFVGKKFIFEGDNVALHRLRRLIESDGTARIVQIGEKKRPVYEAGLTFAVGMTFPMIAAAVDSMRAAGIHAKMAENAVENAVIGAVRAYLRAGRRGWTGAVARSDRDELRRQYQALFEVDEELAEMYLKIAVDYLAETAARGRTGKASK